MNPADIVVILGGIAAIVWVNWYFFRAGRGAPALVAAAAGGFSEATIEVHGGYSPSTIRVPAGRPVRLNFHRTESNPCTEEVVLGDFGVRTYLPAGQTTTVEITPHTPGTFDFSCGMGMVHGTLIVEEGSGT
jgi:plastocyanin domain-containing protein